MRVPRHLAACLGAMLVLSCGDPMGMCACPPTAFRAVLKGRVTGPEGQPVPGAWVVAEIGRPGCTEQVYPAGQVRTGADGGYRLDLVDPRNPRPGDCLRAYATPPSAALLASDTVPFAVAFGANRVVDSVRVDLVLRAP